MNWCAFLTFTSRPRKPKSVSCTTLFANGSQRVVIVYFKQAINNANVGVHLRMRFSYLATGVTAGLPTDVLCSHDMYRSIRRRTGEVGSDINIGILFESQK